MNITTECETYFLRSFLNCIVYPFFIYGIIVTGD